jgi:hypothetical protein
MKQLFFRDCPKVHHQTNNSNMSKTIVNRGKQDNQTTSHQPKPSRLNFSYCFLIFFSFRLFLLGLSDIFYHFLFVFFFYLFSLFISLSFCYFFLIFFCALLFIISRTGA